ncbi:MAG: RNA-guided endonuclease InsQ/TnpB family protein [Nitrososphaerales archaeon]
MVNEAIRIGFEKKPKTRFQLISMVYNYFKERYGLHTHYILNACECAFSMLRNRRWKKKPYAKHLFLKLDNQTYQLNYMTLRMPVKPREFIIIPLIGGEYQMQFLKDATLKIGSITLTPSTCVIAFSKETAMVEPLRMVAYDINEKSIVSSNNEKIDLSHIANIKHQYSRIRASIAKNFHSDRRIKQKLLPKYGLREHRRVVQSLHKISKAIVEKAKTVKPCIILEKLTNILKNHRKGNGEGRKLRGRLHRWSFRELQNQIEYKAKWEGIPVEYVRASNTSRTCSSCGYLNKALTYEKCWTCPNCGIQHDRDANAAMNLLSRFKEAGVVRSSDEGFAVEAMVLP